MSMDTVDGIFECNKIGRVEHLKRINASFIHSLSKYQTNQCSPYLK